MSKSNEFKKKMKSKTLRKYFDSYLKQDKSQMTNEELSKMNKLKGLLSNWSNCDIYTLSEKFNLDTDNIEEVIDFIINPDNAYEIGKVVSRESDLKASYYDGYNEPKEFNEDELGPEYYEFLK